MGFEWMSCDDNNNSIVSFVRRGSTPGKQLLFVCNFTPVLHDKYRIPVPCKGVYSLIMNSDDAKYGGDGTKVSTNIKSDKIFCGGKDDSIELVVPPLSTVIFRYNYKEEIQ